MNANECIRKLICKLCPSVFAQTQMSTGYLSQYSEHQLKIQFDNRMDQFRQGI